MLAAPYTNTPQRFLQDDLPKMLAMSPEARKLGCVVKFVIEDGENYYIDFTSGKLLEAPATPAVIVRAYGLDFMALVEGRMSPQDGLLTGRLHLAGDVAKISQLTRAIEAMR